MLGPSDRVHCPIDDLDFRPYYTDGACPICGWRPPGEVARPWWLSADQVWVAFLVMLATSMVMAIVVIAVSATA